MAGNEWLLFAFLFLGAGQWLAEYQAQKRAWQEALVVRPSRWVALLCGNPRGDCTLGLAQAARQLTALVFVVGAPLSLLLPLAWPLRAGLVFLAYAVFALPASILVERARWQAEEAAERLTRRPAL